MYYCEYLLTDSQSVSGDSSSSASIVGPIVGGIFNGEIEYLMYKKLKLCVKSQFMVRINYFAEIDLVTKCI
jgi:hypothetical protein